MTGFEPVASSLPRKRSTPELHRLSKKKSGRRDSNSRPSAWKADALPTELLPLLNFFRPILHNLKVGRAGFEPTKTKSAELQSAPVGHFGIFPTLLLYLQYFKRADRGTRTHDLLITNQLL